MSLLGVPVEPLHWGVPMDSEGENHQQNGNGWSDPRPTTPAESAVFPTVATTTEERMATSSIANPSWPNTATHLVDHGLAPAGLSVPSLGVDPVVATTTAATLMDHQHHGVIHPSEEGVIAECIRHDHGAASVVGYEQQDFLQDQNGSVLLEEAKAEIGAEEQDFIPLPSSYASAYTGTATASILEDPDTMRDDATIASALEAQDRELLAMKRAAALGMENSQANVIVEITEDFHPSEDSNTVQAEFVGQASSSLAPSPPPPPLPPTSPFSDAAPCQSNSSTATIVPDDGIEEAVVIDSEPVNKGSNSAPREAQVLPATEELAGSATSKPPYSSSGRHHRSSRRSSRRQRWAEVTEIQELPDLHPLEREELQARERRAEAQLMGADESYAVAVPEVGTTSSGCDATQADAVVMDSSTTASSTEEAMAQAAAVVPATVTTSEPESSELRYAEVMMEDPNHYDPNYLDRKPSARSRRPSRRQSQQTSLEMIRETSGETQESLSIDANFASRTPFSFPPDATDATAISSIEEELFMDTGAGTPSAAALQVAPSENTADPPYLSPMQRMYRCQSNAEVVDIRDACDIHPAEQEMDENDSTYAEYYGSSVNSCSFPVARATSEGSSLNASNAVASNTIQHNVDSNIVAVANCTPSAVAETVAGSDIAVRGDSLLFESDDMVDANAVETYPLQPTGSVSVLNEEDTAQVVSIQEMVDLHPADAENAVGDSVADLVGSAVTAQPMERSVSSEVHVVDTIARAPFGGQREFSDAEATLVSDEPDGALSALPRSIPVAPTLESATVLPVFDDEVTDLKQEALCTATISSATPDRRLPPDRNESSSDLPMEEEFCYLQRRDREYHRNIASSVGAAGTDAEEDSVNARDGRHSSAPTIVDIPHRSRDTPRSTGVSEHQ